MFYLIIKQYALTREAFGERPPASFSLLYALAVCQNLLEKDSRKIGAERQGFLEKGSLKVAGEPGEALLGRPFLSHSLVHITVCLKTRNPSFGQFLDFLKNGGVARKHSFS